MRFDPVVHVQTRYTTREVEAPRPDPPERAIGHCCSSVPATATSGVFADPDTFDIHRDDLHMGRENRSARYGRRKPGHLGFGMGQHFCMGYAMARQEAIIGSPKLLEAMRNPRPKFASHEGITAPALGSGGFRAPQELWIEFDVE